MAHIYVADSGGGALGGALLFLIIAGGLLYFLPSVIAMIRGVNVGSVIVVNVFLGWTLIGWVAALAMAAGSGARNTTVVVNQNGPVPQQQQQQQIHGMAPGWYQDPWGAAAQRYWDGGAWTGNVA